MSDTEFILFEKYWKNELSLTEKSELEELFGTDQELYQRYQLYQSAIRGLSREGVKDEMRLVMQQGISSGIRWQPLAIAAAITLTIVSSLALLWSGDPSYVNDHFQSYPYTEGLRNEETANQELQNALGYYVDGNYENASTAFAEIDTKTAVTYLYWSQSEIALGQLESAIVLLNKIEDTSQYAALKSWYLGLCYAETGNKAAAIEQLQQLKASDYGYEKARKIIHELSE